MTLKQKNLREGRKKLESLIGLGIYKAESEMLKDYLRNLQARYNSETGLMELRRRLAKRLGPKSLSETLHKMREEEMH